jgi:hypothetical protein
MSNLYIDIKLVQSPKLPQGPCGDLVVSDRNSTATTIICCDGIGSGIKANIAANLCASRLSELLRGGFTLREAFNAAVKTMNQWRSPEKPFTAFCICRILNDGTATILSYEFPPAILLASGCASVIPQQIHSQDVCISSESTCIIEPGDAILLMSDGITQAGMGGTLIKGWETEGVVNFANAQMRKGISPDDIAAMIHGQARNLWARAKGDDCTVVAAKCRQGNFVNILTGPPSHPVNDAKIVQEFVNSLGTHIVCGATTAAIVAKYLGKKVAVSQDASLIAPPKYSIDGIDLVTEGAVTLNQVYNVWDEEEENFEEESGVTELWEHLKKADCVRIIMGCSFNKASDNIAFKQTGILTRDKIIPLLANKLRSQGKLVLVRYV